MDRGGLRERAGMLAQPKGSLKAGMWLVDQPEEISLRIWPSVYGFCTFLCTDGRIYHGIFSEWNKEEFNGEGVIIWPNRRIYAGRWKNGGTDIGGAIRRPDRADGGLVGTLSNVRKGISCRSWPQDFQKQFFYGETSDEEARNEKGILFYQGGEFFAGEIVGGQKSGPGLLRTSAGEFFFGNWENGFMHQQGMYVKWTQDVIDCYIGSFQDTCFEGEGCLFHRKKDEWDFEYAGFWEHGKKSGTGLWNAGGGQLYIGGFRDGQKDGEGQMVLADGSRSSMSWEMGSMAVEIDKIREPGPSRKLYKEGDAVEKAVINSLETSAGIEEQKFVGIRADADAEYQREMVIEPGCDYEVRVFYHNGADKGTAAETKLRAFYTKKIGPGQDGIVSAVISSEDTEVPAVWDAVKISSAEVLAVSYKIASARIRNNWKSNGRVLPQTLFMEGGAELGTDELNGVLPAGESGMVTFMIHAGGKRNDRSVLFTSGTGKAQAASQAKAADRNVVAVVPSGNGKMQALTNAKDSGSAALSVVSSETGKMQASANTKDSGSVAASSVESSAAVGKKRKRSRIWIQIEGSGADGEYGKEVCADVGEEINVKIGFTNSDSQQDLMISVELPPKLEFVAGSASIRLSDGLGQRQEDGWIRSGLLLRNLMGGGEGEIQFKLRYFPSADGEDGCRAAAVLETAYIVMRKELCIKTKYPE